jgi:hypothetical protein
MTFTVGVTGHRWNKLKEANMELLHQQVETVLKDIQQTLQTFDPTASLLLFSPIAEGSDRLVAEAALRLGYTLRCVLPFEKTIYEQDFESEDSKREFRIFLEKAEDVLELPTQPTSSEERNAGYTDAGRKVTAESQVLLAIWDGEKAKGEGGTGQMVEEALTQNHLVVWINAKAPHSIQVLTRGGTRENLPALSDNIRKVVRKTY